MIWSGVLLLAATGAFSAVQQGLMLWGVPVVNHRAAAMAALGSSAGEIAAYDAKFTDYPALTAVHVGAGLVYLVLAPLQFSASIRSRFLQVHRWSGRLLVAAGALFGVSGLALGLVRPFGGPIEASGTTLFGVVFLGALATGVARVRAGDLIGHRRWMIRAFAVAFGISTVRVIMPLFLLLTSWRLDFAFSIAVWAGWLLTAGAGELWLRYGPSPITISSASRS